MTAPESMTAPAAARGWPQQLRSHAAPRFVAIGGLSLVVDVGLLALLHGVVGVPLLIATTVAFVAASLVNFSFNRQWVFRSGRDGRTREQLIRFYALVLANLLSTLLITGGLSAVGVPYLIAKLIAAVVNAAANFWLYRSWVFNSNSTGRRGGGQDVDAVAQAPHEADAVPASGRVPTQPSRRQRIAKAGARALLLFIITCTATAGVVVHQVQTNRPLSPVDETTYVDYLAKVNDGHFIIGRGEHLGSVASNAVACRGIGTVVAPRPEACNGADPKPYRPSNTADIDPPTYYLITDGIARALIGIGVTHDLVNAGRLAGIFWGGAGLAALFGLCLLLGASKISSALVCGATLATIGFWIRWAQVTPHATDLLVGSLAAIATLMWVRRRAPRWLLFLVGAVPVFVKASDVTIVATLVIFLLALAFWPQSDTVTERRTRRDLLIGAALLIAGLALATLAWLLVRDHYALTKVNNFPQYNVDHFDFRWLTHALAVFGASYQTAVMSGIGMIFTIWILGSVVYQFSDRHGSLELRTLSFAGLVMIIFGAWLYVVSNYVLLHQYNPIPGRYGTTLMPVLIALTARNIRGRTAQIVATFFLILFIVNIYTPL